MKTPIPVTWLILIAAHSFAASPEHVYPSNVGTALEFGSVLYGDLNPQFQKQLYPQPVCMGPVDSPAITLIGNDTENTMSRQVCISAGFIDLLNHVAHAKAIDRIQPGFFRQYVRALGDPTAFKSPDIDEPRFWKDDVMNDQASYFNQMIGAITAINLSHIYLGQVNKYSGRMPAGRLAPINDLLTPAEWEASVKEGMLNAFNCGSMTEGIKILIEAIDMMPTRPAWTAFVVPNHADVKKLNKQLTRLEVLFFQGRLKD
jgi:hypothetical protein